LRRVFNTNVLVSALLLPDSKPRHAFYLALQIGGVLLSFAALAELDEVLNPKKFLRFDWGEGLPGERIATCLAAQENKSE
jgi:hypothetical protein